MKLKKFLPYLIIVLIGLLPLLDLFHPGLPITHDGQDHVARVANFYQSLSEGNIIPRWAGNLNWGYGHPILMFLYPLPSYIASLFHFLGFSLIDSVKIVFGLTFVLSGISMYLWVSEFLPLTAAIISSVLYMFAPYRFIDLYVRGDLGEHVAFAFLPLVFYFLLKVSKSKNNLFLILGALSFALLILSHNAVSLMFTPVIFLYALYLIYLNKNKKLLFYKYLIFAVLGFCLSAFFWIPAFFEGKYTLRDIVTKNDYLTRFVNFRDLLYGNWNYGGTGQFSVQVGIIQWIAVILSLPVTFFLYIRRDKLWILSSGLLLVFLFSIFLMLPSSNFIWQKLNIIQKFQFPWRFLSISIFASSVLGGVVVSQLKGHRKLFAIIFIVFILLLNKDYWHAKGYLLKNQSFFTGIYNSTTDTGESSPIWSVRFMEQRPKAHMEVISGNAGIKETFRNSTNHKYIVSASVPSRLRENTLYFPGWHITVDGREVPIQFQDPKNRGLMTFNVSSGKHFIVAYFNETKLRLFSDYLSLFGILGILLLWKNKLFR